MWRLVALLLLHRVSTEECPIVGTSERNSSQAGPRSPRVLNDIVGLDDAKEVLKEAIVLPAKVPASQMRLFWRSGERSAVLLVGPSGLGKVAVAEAAAHEAGALVLSLSAREVASSGACRVALSTARSEGRAVVVIVEAIEASPKASVYISQCLREASESDDTMSRVFFVATMSHELPHAMSATALIPFGYVVRLGMPSDQDRSKFLKELLAKISRIDPQWSAAFPQASVSTLANLTAKYTFGEIELVVRRAFIRSMNDEGSRDPVALHHFEKILEGMPPQASLAFNETVSVAELSTVAAGEATGGEPRKTSTDSGKKKSKEVKDPMDGIFGWCNFWLPEALHLPPVVWAMIIFGILAHFMARSTYQPHTRKGRSGRGGRTGSLFGSAGYPDLGGSGGYGGLGGDLGDLGSGGDFRNLLGAGAFPGPPGYDLSGSGAGRGRGEGEGSDANRSSGLPTASSEPKAASPH